MHYKRLEPGRCKSMQTWKWEIKRKKGWRQQNTSKCLGSGKIIISSGGGGATGHHLSAQKMLSASTLQHPRTQWIPSHGFSHHLNLPRSIIFLEETGNFQKFSVVQRPASASSQTCAPMMWPGAPWCHPVEPYFLYIKAPPLWGALHGKKTELFWGGLIWDDALKKPTLYFFGRKQASRSGFPPTSGSCSVSYCTVQCSGFKTVQMNPMRLILNLI